VEEHKEKKPSQPIGTGHAAAMARLGLAELRAAFYPESNVARHSEYGLYGTKTPGEVADDRREDSRDSADDRGKDDSVLASKMRQAGPRDDPGKDDRDPGLDR
jgi:hypothetical protein